MGTKKPSKTPRLLQRKDLAPKKPDAVKAGYRVVPVSIRKAGGAPEL